MSEMATRLSDGQSVKIGTCESMYYCRWDQRNEVDYPDMTTGLHWRLPLPDEDGIKPGDFEDYRILKYDERTRMSWIPWDARLNVLAIPDEDKKGLAECTGIVQTTVDALGLLVNVTCHHGLALNESVDGSVKFFWNGKRDALYFDGVWNKEKELRVGMACAACGESWSMPYQEAEPLFCSLRMKLRLLHECSDYWHEHNEGECPYTAFSEDKRHRILKMRSLAKGCYAVYADGAEVCAGTWDQALHNFVSLLPGYDDRKEEREWNEKWNTLCHEGEELKKDVLIAV